MFIQNKYDLWQEYKTTKDCKRKLDIRNQLIEEYYPLVKKIAKSLSENINRRILDDELTSYGVDGLYIAIDRYDAERGIKFESFASLRIKGAMLDEIRKLDVVPRSVRMNSRWFEDTRMKLEAEKSRLVSDYEIIQEMGLDEKEYLINLRNYKPSNISSLDGSSNTEDTEDFRQDCNTNLKDCKSMEPDSLMKRKEFFNKLLGKNFSSLERKIIYMYYYQNLTMDIVAQKVNLSESRVSQIHTNLLPRLRDKIERNPNYFSKDISSFISSSSSDILF